MNIIEKLFCKHTKTEWKAIVGGRERQRCVKCKKILGVRYVTLGKARSKRRKTRR